MKRTDNEPMIILSLGVGVQSSTIFLMSCYGEIEKIDCAIFADPMWETKAVYEWFKFLKSEGEKHGIEIHTVSSGNIKEDALVSHVRAEFGKRAASMPYFVLGPEEIRKRLDIGKKEKVRIISDSGEIVTLRKLGMINRQCTYEYKIRPIQKLQRKLLGYKPRQRIPPGSMETWKGISTDEKKRANMSDVRWIDFHYPLIEHGMSRGDCLLWFEKNGLPRPPRSACIGCPFKSNDEWRYLKDNSPEEWEDAVLFDRKIRDSGGGKLRGEVFIHSDRIPLDQVDLSNIHDSGQLNFFDNECMGVCGV